MQACEGFAEKEWIGVYFNSQGWCTALQSLQRNAINRQCHGDVWIRQGVFNCSGQFGF